MNSSRQYYLISWSRFQRREMAVLEGGGAGGEAVANICEPTGLLKFLVAGKMWNNRLIHFKKSTKHKEE